MPAGRKTKRTPELEADLLSVIRAGNTIRAACAYVGIDQDTFTNWKNRHSDFSDAVKKAESHPEVRNVALIQKTAEKTWTAAAWWLERRHPDDWRQRQTIDIRQLTDEQVDGALARAAAAISAGEGKADTTGTPVGEDTAEPDP